MRVDEVSFERVEVALSERNLIALLNKVRRPDSFRTLEFEQPVEDEGPGGAPETVHVTLVVRAEPDDEHYEGRDTPPGEVVPEDLLEPTEHRPVDRSEQPTEILDRVEEGAR